MRILLILSCYLATSSFAQNRVGQAEIPNPKQLKKEIGIKGIKEVIPFEKDPSLVIFKSKRHQGLYDTKRKRYWPTLLLK